MIQFPRNSGLRSFAVAAQRAASERLKAVGAGGVIDETVLPGLRRISQKTRKKHLSAS
jgi:hypothetical protein